MDTFAELRSISGRLSEIDALAEAKSAAGTELVKEYRAKGIDPTRDKEAFEAVDAAFSEADALKAEANELRDKASGLIVSSGSAHGLDARGLGPGSAPFGLTSDMLEELRDAATRGQLGRVGMQSAIPLSNFPPADRVGYDLNVFAILQETTRIADFIPREGIDTASKTFYRVTTGATAAAAVAAGADKPESSPVIEAVTADVKKIAHFGSVEDEIIKDYSAWSDVVSLEFINGLISEENSQLLSGDGTGANQLGLLETPGVLSVERDTTNETRLAALARADAALRNGAAKCKPTIRIMHPTDALETRLETDDNGQFLAGPPSSSLAQDFWNVLTVETTDMPVGTSVVANLGLAAKIYWRETPIFEVHPNGGGLAEWKANKTLVRAEERLLQAVVRAAAICLVEDM